jgi:hypothetical protein
VASQNTYRNAPYSHPSYQSKKVASNAFFHSRDIQKKSGQNIKNSVIGNGKIFGFIQFFGQAFAKTSCCRASGTWHSASALRKPGFPQANIKTVLGDRFPKTAAFRSSKKLLGVMERP